MPRKNHRRPSKPGKGPILFHNGKPDPAGQAIGRARRKGTLNRDDFSFLRKRKGVRRGFRLEQIQLDRAGRRNTRRNNKQMASPFSGRNRRPDTRRPSPKSTPKSTPKATPKATPKVTPRPSGSTAQKSAVKKIGRFSRFARSRTGKVAAGLALAGAGVAAFRAFKRRKKTRASSLRTSRR